jgi:hypothetical protein
MDRVADVAEVLVDLGLDHLLRIPVDAQVFSPVLKGMTW